MRSTAIVTALLMVPAMCRAEVTLDQYRETIKTERGRHELEIYVTGVGRGIIWADTALEHENREPLFCMPRKLAPDGGIIQSLLDQEMRAPSSGATYSATTPIEFILVRAFTERFPCSAAAPAPIP